MPAVMKILLMEVLLPLSIIWATPMDPCDSKLNPRDLAKAGRETTDTFFACKSEIMDMNIKPSFIHELRRACVVVRLCHADTQQYWKNRTAFNKAMGDCMLKAGSYFDAVYPVFKEKYNIVLKDILTRFNNCYNWSPDVRYILFAMRWLRDMMSG
ncbi:uncharacterized protein [Dermacentor andersoni]|uniref:uncharacterized protein isoform X1 n=1 Tax=Dermacentor andersoni TaxID=34620 RepID=UPI0021557335|nr:uncharacterized protein LOC126535307 isoform X1 [Dermacentor andersoni]